MRRVVLLAVMVVSIVVAQAWAAETSIVNVTLGGVKLTVPSDVPAGQVWRYGLGMPIQLDATTAGMLVNIRRIGTRYWDFEVGTDLVKFDRLDDLNAKHAVPISRSASEPHPDDGSPANAAKYPLYGGFVPRGARLADGAVHPYGGTGFGISIVGFYPGDLSQPMPKGIRREMEMSQFRYDGGVFTASRAIRYKGEGIPVGDTGWSIVGGSMSAAIPDAADLLHPVTCRNGVGVARFRHVGSSGWQPVAFVPVVEGEYTEPSLIRDVDGSLLFTARNRIGQVSGNREEVDISLWRSADGRAGTWSRSFFVAGVRQRTPLSLNQAADGAPYIATSTVPGSYRSFLQILPLDSARLALLPAITVRDSTRDFGDGPKGKGWMVDHPIGNVVRLADGQWHAILAYRVMARQDTAEEPAATYAGLYVEEVFASGSPRPTGFVFKAD